VHVQTRAGTTGPPRAYILHPVQPQRAAEPRAGDRRALDLQVVVERDNRNTSVQQRAQQRLEPLWARRAPTVTAFGLAATVGACC
jgi:hypothetical protein